MAQKKVLVVDDLAEIGRMLQAALATISDQLVVKVVPSAEEGLLEATRNPADLMIIDVRLPGISGLELTRRVRQRQREVKVIQISGMDDISLEQQAMQAGANMFFRKPLAMTEFLAAVERILEIKKTAPIAATASGEAAPSGYPNRLSEMVGQLRQKVNAAAVSLLDDLGHRLVQDGELAESLTGSGALGGLVTAVEAATKVSQSLGQAEGEMVMFFRGESWDLMASPLNTNVLLLVVFKQGASRVATAIAFDEILRARLNILGLMRDKGTFSSSRKKTARTGTLEAPQPAVDTRVEPVATPAASPVEAVESQLLDPVPIPDAAVDARLAADLESQDKEKAAAAGDMDAFWEEAAEKLPASKTPSRSNTLTYEQAQKMGLAPGSDESGANKK